MVMRGDKRDGDLVFTMAASDTVADMEQSFGVEVNSRWTRTRQRGVWELEMTAFTSNGQSSRRIAAVASMWPNSGTGSFATFLYQQSHKLYLMVESWHVEEQRPDHGR